MTALDLQFTNFSDAFDFCRECDHPVSVTITGERWKLFPSGRAEQAFHTLACGCRIPAGGDIHERMRRLTEHLKRCDKAK